MAQKAQVDAMDIGTVIVMATITVMVPITTMGAMKNKKSRFLPTKRNRFSRDTICGSLTEASH